ncbi:hypothetical protein BASA81_003769 [Batrachochytrium salamandrivorans]|nr:hypothetical protein BASA81_003769 [Batrachochytrium salamandrivorans]
MSLLDHEKSALAKKVGSTASIIITSVVRFYLASPNPKAKKNDPNSVIKNFPDISDRQWKFTNVVGALVLLVDRTLDTFLFRIYDLEGEHELRFEYELYEDIEYKALDVQFHAFEMDDCVGGFSFANKEEAPKFLSKVNALKPTSKGGAVDALKGKKKPAASGGGGGLFGKKPKPKPVMEVSAVINVTHTQHVGVGADGGFDLNNISPEWKALFKQAGIRKKDLANPETAQAIADTIIRSQPVDQHAQLKAQMAPPRAATPAMAAVPAVQPRQQQQQQQAVTAAPAVQQQQQAVLDPLAMDLEQAKQVYTPEQVRELEAYREAMRKYEEEMAAYEAEQAALAAWERDNKKLIAEKEAKALADEQERARREKQAKELAEKKRIAKDLADLQAQQALLEAQLKEKDRIMAEKNAEQEKMLKEAGSKGVAPAPPPRKVVVTISEEAAYVPPPIPAMVVDLPPLPVRRNSRSKSVVQKIVEVVKGPSPEEIAAELAAEEEERQQRAELLRQRQLEAIRQEEEFTRKEEELRKKRTEDRARALQEEESNWKEERERIRREMESTIRAEEAEIYKRAEAERLRMQQEAAEEQTRIQQQINQAKSQAEKQRAEEMFRLAALESERARAEQEARELRAAEEREQARLAAEQAQREQEEVLLQLQIMQMKTAEAKRLVEEEERRQEELRKEAAKKKAPPIPARLPERPPLPPPPASAPRPPPPPPAMAGAFKPEIGSGGRPPLPPGGISGVLNGLGAVQLKKTENIADKSGPNVTGKMGRDAQKNAFLGALEKGVQLKKADGSKASITNAAQKAQLPKLTQQNDQAGLMASLIATMGARRGALNGDSDEDDDDWSD